MVSVSTHILGLLQTWITFLLFKTSLLQLFRRMLQCCFAAKLQKCFFGTTKLTFHRFEGSIQWLNINLGVTLSLKPTWRKVCNSIKAAEEAPVRLRTTNLSFTGELVSLFVPSPSSDPYAWGDTFPSCHPLLGVHHSPINLDDQMIRNESLGPLHLEGFDAIQTGHWTLQNDGHSGEYATDALTNVLFANSCWWPHVSRRLQSCCMLAVACRWAAEVFQMCTTPSSCTSTGEAHPPTAQSTQWTDADTRWRYSTVSRQRRSVTGQLSQQTGDSVP